MGCVGRTIQQAVQVSYPKNRRNFCMETEVRGIKIEVIVEIIGGKLSGGQAKSRSKKENKFIKD